MNRGVVLAIAEMFCFEPGSEAVQAEYSRLCRRLGLRGDELAGWAKRNDLDPDDLLRLVREEATLRHMRSWLQHRSWLSAGIGPTLDHLRLRGEYEEWADRTASARSVLDMRRPDPARSLPPLDVGKLIEAQTAATGFVPDAVLDEWACGNGFLSAGDVVRALYEQQLVREASADRVT